MSAAHPHRPLLVLLAPPAMARRGRVGGLVHPRGQDVTVYVQARDGRWYLQAPSTGHKSRWSAPVVLGVDASPSGTVYTVAACLGRNPFGAEVLDALPEAPEGRWEYAKVVLA
jgi:hypothetical protein